VLALRSETEPKTSQAEQVKRHFQGDRSSWRKPYTGVMRKESQFGPDVTVSLTDTCITIRGKCKKFAIVGATAARLDIGIKRR